MGTVPLQAERRSGVRASRRLLRLAGDDRLVAEMRRGNEAALEAAYDRHGGAILSFCRHMLGSPEEAEEAVQHSFAAAWADVQHNERPIRLRPWLYAIARNRCLSLLRSRRADAVELDEDRVATAGLSEEVAHRADLRALLADLRDLPDEQRAALVLSELEGLSHADVAEVLGRKEQEVKALVFRARSSLGEWRKARETPCQEVREQLSVLSGGSLRRSWLRRHLQTCEGCREFRDQVKEQRQMMALLLPVAPTAGLKGGVLAAAGLGGGAAGGGAVAGGLGAAALSSVGAKVAIVAVVAGGAVTAERTLDGSERGSKGPAAPAQAAPPPAGDADASSALSPSAVGGGPAARQRVREGAGEKPGRRVARRRRRGARRGAPAGTPPVDTPVRAKGSPPAVGRVRRGLAPPPTGPTAGSGKPAKEKAAKEPRAKKTPAPAAGKKPIPPGLLLKEPKG